ncbi:MAG: penicillin acylase family protein, partial [Desulfobacterales bacterium]|nr:penicillin acylase family protein [Desulfobacterales bacterium]
EILGPKLLDVDKKFRTLMLRHRAQEYLAEEDKINQDALGFLDDFLDGVNHFAETAPLPVEFKLLGITPKPFTRLDAISIMGYVAYSFADGITRDSLHTMLASRLSSEELAIVFPDFTLDNRETIMEPQGVPRGQEVSFEGLSKKSQCNLSSNTFKQKNDFNNFALAFQEIKDTAQKIFPSFTGSNSWVLAPSRSKNGHALLANDPHIGIANPGVWYEAHVKYPGYENYGYHLPLLPFPMLAHNSTKAWAITMFENDDMDLYAEEFNPDDPTQVKFKGEWTKVETLTETIKVKGEADASLTIRVTPHGPVISDFIKGYEGKPVSLSWVFHKVDNPILDVVYDMGRAKTMSEFKTALADLAAPGLNISYIDASGNIGWWAAGRLPIRPPHVSGLEIHDGSSGKDDALGYLPFEKNPQMENPENGMIVTANNLSTMMPIDPVGVLTGYFRPSDRAARIYELLTRQEKWELEGMKSIQTDTRLFSGPAMNKGILAALKTEKDTFSDLESKAFDALSDWDGFMGLETIGGTVFQFTTYHILKQALADRMGQELFNTYLEHVDYWSFLKRFFRTGKTIAETQGDQVPKPAEAIIRQGFKDAVLELVAKYGTDETKWSWGNVHTIEFEHAIGKKKPLNKIFNIGPFPSPAEFTSVNKLRSEISRRDFKVVSIPSTRRLIDCNDPESSLSVLPTGNSGNFMSPFYKDQAQMFITGQYRSMQLSETGFSKGKSHILTLAPE